MNSQRRARDKKKVVSDDKELWLMYSELIINLLDKIGHVTRHQFDILKPIESTL